MGTLVKIPNADFGNSGMILDNAINIETVDGGAYHFKKNGENTYVILEDNAADIELAADDTSVDFGDTNDGASISAYKLKYAEVHSANNKTALSFWNCINLESVNLEDWDCSAIQKMTKMFFKCKSLSNIDFSQFKNNACFEFNYMFYGCESLVDVDFNTMPFGSIYASLEAIFNACINLGTFNMASHTEKAKVNTMKNMFAGCTKLKDVDFGVFNGERLSTINRMFAECKSLSVVDFSGFSFPTLKDASYAFIDAIANKIVFNQPTPLLTNTEQMFVRCDVQEIELNGWVVPALANANNMFVDCSKVKELDLSGVTFASEATANNMFRGCVNLTKVKCNSGNSATLLARLQADMSNYTWTLDDAETEINRSNTEV